MSPSLITTTIGFKSQLQTAPSPPSIPSFVTVPDNQLNIGVIAQRQKNLVFSKMCPNFEPRLRGVVYQLSWVTIHNIKPTHVDYYHVEGFKDCSMYSRKNLVLIIHTRDETPCMILKMI